MNACGMRDGLSGDMLSLSQHCLVVKFRVRLTLKEIT